MRTGNQKRLTSRGKVIVNFEIEPEYDMQLNELAKKTDRSKSSLVRTILKGYLNKLNKVSLEDIG